MVVACNRTTVERVTAPKNSQYTLFRVSPVRLSRLCHAKLEEAEGKIELLLKDARGDLVLDASGRPKKTPFTGGNG